MKFTTLVPLRRNDGSAVERAEMDAIMLKFWTRFNGLTVDGQTKGYWVDNNTLYEDECLKLVVVCDDSRQAELEAIVREIGQQLGQLAMYVEIDRSTEVKIMKID